MLFCPKDYISWDTWMYYYNNKYYLYYLITDYSPGEGFGVAISKDGIHFEDKGKCISPSEKMVVYLGTGAICTGKCDYNGYFISNYSEWRQGNGDDVFQNILFARSKDLVHWEKLGDEHMFSLNDEFYETDHRKEARWDCIFPLETKDGYFGYYTAKPKDYIGCGFAVSLDGIKWEAKKPPRFLLEEKGAEHGIEVGGVCTHNDKYYILVGTYINKFGMCVLTSNTPNGEFVPQKKNFALLSNNSFRHAYFMRIFNIGDELFVNHHVISRKENEHERPYTYLAPIKRVTFDDEDILRLSWYEINDNLKGEKISYNNLGDNFFVEGKLNFNRITFQSSQYITKFEFDLKDGVVKIFENNKVVEVIEKDMEFKNGNIKLIKAGTFVEFYIDNYFITSYTLLDKKQIICIDNSVDYEFTNLNIDKVKDYE